MKLHKLFLRNFRGFTDLELQFEHDVTVLVGTNGAGKTSILDAIALLLTRLANGVITGAVDGWEPTENDIRAGQHETALRLCADINGQETTWSVARTLPLLPPGETTDLAQLSERIDTVRRDSAGGAPTLPLAVYFPTNRNALDIPVRLRELHEFTSVSAYDGALTSGERNFRAFFEWFRQEEDLYNEQKVAGIFDRHEEVPPLGLPVVRAAIEGLFPGATELRIERRPQRMTLLLNGTRLDVAQLSDGEKVLLSMAGDLARRMFLAAPKMDKPLEQEAVVLIDELELHLHPGLQRTIIRRLMEVFPNTQFVVTTHSPQVLSSVRSTRVRLLEGFKLNTLDRGTWHRDTNRILEAVFNDPGRPPDVAARINELRDAVDADDRDRARALISELRERIEGDDPEVFELEQMLPPEDGPEVAG